MSSDADSALDAFLALIGERGYEAVTLRDVAERADSNVAELYRAYPDKAALAAAFLARIDREVLEGAPTAGDSEETARDRLFDAMMRRFDSLKAHRAAWRAIRRAATRDPVLALRLADPLRRSLAATLEAASLASDGLPGALRQNGLLVIHLAVARVFDRDDTTDLSKTMAALDSRLKTTERWAQLIDKYTKSTSERGSAKSPETTET